MVSNVYSWQWKTKMLIKLHEYRLIGSFNVGLKQVHKVYRGYTKYIGVI